jgi:hypothetical protein
MRDWEEDLRGLRENIARVKRDISVELLFRSNGLTISGLPDAYITERENNDGISR